MNKLVSLIKLLLIFILFILIESCKPSIGDSIKPIDHGNLDMKGNQWFSFLEWSLRNPSYSGNPFDIIAWVVFTHQGSGEIRRTQMFFAGNDVWKFRFTGTKVGNWDFVTESGQTNLNGRTGSIVIAPNPVSITKGFLTNYYNKFAQQIGVDGYLEAVLLNIYLNELDWADFSDGGYLSSKYEDFDSQINEVLSNGCNAIHLSVANSWFQYGAKSYNQHRSIVPDLKTFEKLESIITHAYRRGVHVHIWAWGDEERKRTPIGVGGNNGVADKRLQRYIAARLGPLPGWSMSYGFDLEEWVSESQVGEWASYLHEHMGWPHLLMARGRIHPELDVRSISNYGGPNDIPRSYLDVARDMEFDKSRPHLYEERFLHKRWNYFSMDVTRRHMWWYAMAGGMGGFWGVMRRGGYHYPNSELMLTHKHFWEGRFLLNMEPVNGLTDGLCLKSRGENKYVFYKEDTSSIKMDLSDMNGQQAAIAVDTKQNYKEINLGMLAADKKIWKAPYLSDWAIAVGSFRTP